MNKNNIEEWIRKVAETLRYTTLEKFIKVLIASFEVEDIVHLLIWRQFWNHLKFFGIIWDMDIK